MGLLNLYELYQLFQTLYTLQIDFASLFQSTTDFRTEIVETKTDFEKRQLIIAERDKQNKISLAETEQKVPGFIHYPNSQREKSNGKWKINGIFICNSGSLCASFLNYSNQEV